MFILFILKHFLDRDLLPRRPIYSEIDHTKSPLTCYPFDFIPAGRRLGPLCLEVVGVSFMLLVNLSFQVFVGCEGFGFCDSDKSFGLVGTFEHVLGIDVDIFGFGDDPLCFFELFLQLGMLGHLLDLSHHPPMHLLVWVPPLLKRQRFVNEHQIIYYANQTNYVREGISNHHIHKYSHRLTIYLAISPVSRVDLV